MDDSLLFLYIIALLVSLCCALSGTLLTVQKKAMLGDAISHSSLLGLVLAYLISGERSITYMLIGALVAGIGTAYLTEKLKTKLRIQYDAALGVLFTTSFAIAVILISQYARQVDLDQHCVLFGEIALAPFDTILLGDANLGPRALWTLSLALICNIMVIGLCWNRIKAVLFSAKFMQAIGLKYHYWQQVCSSLVAITAVSAFESVGAILVVALLVIPSNSARLLVKDSLIKYMMMSLVFALIAAIQGIIISLWLDTSIAATIATVLFINFLLLNLMKTKAQKSRPLHEKLSQPNFQK